MHRLALVTSLGIILLAARPAAGDTMLYATAATVGRVDGFCVNRGGALTPGASVHADTGVDPSSPGVHDSSSNPRRILVGNGGLGPCSAQRSTVCQGGSRAGQMCSTEDANATTGCPGATCPGCCVAATRPISERRRIQRPRPFVIMGDRLYVDEVGTARIKGF